MNWPAGAHINASLGKKLNGIIARARAQKFKIFALGTSSIVTHMLCQSQCCRYSCGILIHIKVVVKVGDSCPFDSKLLINVYVRTKVESIELEILIFQIHWC